GDAVGVADRVDAGGTDPLDVALRSKVLTFFVNHAPVLLQSNSQFKPRPNTTIPRVVTNTVFNLLATDDDPFDPSPFNRGGGTPTHDRLAILRGKSATFGKFFGAMRGMVWTADRAFSSPTETNCEIPPLIASGSITLRVRLCDCAQCDALPGTATCPLIGQEANAGQGTCVDTDIPLILSGPQPGANLGANQPAPTRPPGGSPDPGRRER